MARKKNDEIFFDEAFLMLRTSRNVLLVWQKAPNPPSEPGGWEGPTLAGVFDIKKNLFQNNSQVTKFSADQWFPPAHHRLELWWKYGDVDENGRCVHVGRRITYVSSPTQKEMNRYKKWERLGSPIYDIDKDEPLPRVSS